MVNISRQLLAAPDGGPQGRRHIVDFCGGTGALALPLAASMPDCDVTIVDVSAHSLVRDTAPVAPAPVECAVWRGAAAIRLAIASGSCHQ
jgi:ubiquinone/menaquinone biosynthesis C-methylase UbiE